MAKQGKGKLRTALANHQARSQQRQQEKKRAETREHAHKRKHASMRPVGSTRPATAAKPKPLRRIAPFFRDDTILLVGEGNFSFTLALLSAPHSHPPHLVLATSFDSEDEVCRKYPDAADILAQIRALAGVDADRILAFGVDAGRLHRTEAVTGGAKTEHAKQRWSKVWFGFPHVGAGHKDEQRNVLANQLLLLRFLVSVAPCLTRGALPSYATKEKKVAPSDDSDDEASDAEDEETRDFLAVLQSMDKDTRQPFAPPARQGSVLITLRNVAPYTLWNVPMLGKRLLSVLAPIVAAAPSLPKNMRAPSVADAERAGAHYTLWRSFQFFPDDWPGYSHRRTIGWVEGRSTSHNEDLLRTTQATPVAGQKHVGTGECRTWELGLLPELLK